MAEFHETGKKGEEIAVSFLKQHGYSILEKNWRSGSAEIDIIAKKDDFIIVIEVKTRRTDYFGEPEEFVTKAKQKQLVKAADSYVLKNKLENEVRFDIISVLFKGKDHAIHHIEDAFYPALS